MQYPDKVRQWIARQAPGAPGEENLSNDLPLMTGGLGMDSLAVIELILACEKEFGVEFSEEFLNRGELTVGMLIDEVVRCGADNP